MPATSEKAPNSRTREATPRNVITCHDAFDIVQLDVKSTTLHVDTAQISLPVRLSALGVHLMSDRIGAACDTPSFAAAARRHRAVSNASEHFDPLKGASCAALVGCGLACLAGLNPA